MELLGTDFMPATFDLSVLKGAAGGAGRFDGRLVYNHPQDLKLVSNDAPCDLPQSALKIRLKKTYLFIF
jgi:hypothetical protein